MGICSCLQSTVFVPFLFRISICILYDCADSKNCRDSSMGMRLLAVHWLLCRESSHRLNYSSPVHLQNATLALFRTKARLCVFDQHETPVWHEKMRFDLATVSSSVHRKCGLMKLEIVINIKSVHCSNNMLQNPAAGLDSKPWIHLWYQKINLP